MTLQGKKILILAGSDLHSKVVKAARELGVYTIVTDYLDPEHSPAKLIADEYWMYDINDVDAIVERCLEVGVDGVLNFCIDPAQKPYQKICERLNLPCWYDSSMIEQMTSKILFKKLCKKCGMSVVPEYTLSDVNEGMVEYPVLVKPSDSRGSRGQTKCYNKSEVLKAIEIAKSESQDHCCLIEKFIEGGKDIAISYAVIDGVTYLVKLGDRILGAKEDNLDRQQIAAVLPSFYYKEIVEGLNLKVDFLVRELGMKFGAIFLQGFYQDGDIYMYDPGLRFPGTDFDLVVRDTTGFDSMKTFVEFAITGNIRSCFGNPQDAYLMNGNICLIFDIASKGGVIKDIVGFDDVIKNEYTLTGSKRILPGEKVIEAGDVRQRVLEFVACLPGREKINEYVDYVYDHVRIIGERGEDMIVSRIKAI